MNHPLHTVEQLTVLTTPNPGFKQRLAATELRRGLHQLGYAGPTTVGQLPGPDTLANELRFVLMAGSSVAETYEISTERSENGAVIINLMGAGQQALLYAVFDFLERQGAFFGIDGDVYPIDSPSALELPEINQPWQGEPRFGTRGLLPWPDFLNCITVYNREDWRAYLEAMLRMRFNTLGIHVYGQEKKWAESFLSFEYGGVGHAAFTDTTATDRWGCLPQRTSRYGMGAAQYFDDEVFGADATRQARNPWEAAELAQALWREAFAYAEKLGIRTGVGFEPYRVPEEIRRACPPEVRTEDVYEFKGTTRRIERLDPESRTAQYILESRLAQLLKAYPSVSHVYLWEDEFMNWASQVQDAPLPVTPFLQAHDFLRRHAPDKRLVLAGWGGVVRHFDDFHRQLPEDVIFTALSDQLGWDPVHEAFGGLGDRERWPIPWLEDDPAMWFPQFHVHRFSKDMDLAEQYGCQGMLGIHWRHRIVDPTAGYFARRTWEDQLQPDAYYVQYARTRAAGERAADLARWLTETDAQRRLLCTWTGEIDAQGHAVTQEYSGDYGEAFSIQSGVELSTEFIEDQARAITELGSLVAQAESSIEQERLHYLYGQVRFLDPYARAWNAGVRLHKLLSGQQKRKRASLIEEARQAVLAQGVPLWVELLTHVRAAVLAFQHTVATRNDLGMLASIHNKFVRIATFRLRASLLEFLEELPSEAEEASEAALAPDQEREATVFVPSRPTRLAPGERVNITAIAPGTRELCGMILLWRPIGITSWERRRMQHVGRRTYVWELTMPLDAEFGIEYYVEATFAGTPSPVVVAAPPQGAGRGYLINYLAESG